MPSTRLAAAEEPNLEPLVRPQALVYRQSKSFLTYSEPLSCPNPARMTTPAPAPWQVSNDAPAAGALVEAIEGLLEEATPIVWGDVLATALALKAILVRNPDAEPVCTHIDVNVICKCYVELGSPGEIGSLSPNSLLLVRCGLQRELCFICSHLQSLDKLWMVS